MQKAAKTLGSLLALTMLAGLIVVLAMLAGRALPANAPGAATEKAPPGTEIAPTVEPKWAEATRVAEATVAAMPTAPEPTPQPSPLPMPPGTPVAGRFAVLSPDNVAGLAQQASIRFNDAEGFIYGMSVSPDGRLLAVNAPGARVWDIVEGRERAALWPPGPAWQSHSNVTARGFSADGRYLAVESSAGNLLWNTADQTWMEIPVKGTWVRELTFSPDGRRVAWIDWDGQDLTWEVIIIADAGTWQEVMRFRHFSDANENTNPLRRMAFSNDGNLLAAADQGGSFEVWSLVSGERVFAQKSQRWYPDTLAFFPSDRLLLFATGKSRDFEDSYPKIWDVVEGRLITRWAIPEDSSQLHIALSPDGRLAATGGMWDGSVQLWDLRNPASPQPLFTLRGHASLVCQLAFSRDGTLLVTGSYDGTVGIWGVP